MITDLQKRTIQAIVNIFETGRPLGDYGKVTLLAGDSGHLTYGRSQTTLASGNLFLLIKDYCAAPDAAFADQLSPFLPRLEGHDPSLDRDMEFRGLLREAGDDSVMQSVQDTFFDRVYWEPALASAAFINCETALGHAVVYDSRIHGSWHMIRDRTIAAHGTLADIGERIWIPHYVETRREWLANHSNTLLHKTTYRMDAMRDLIAGNLWDLPLPITVRGVTISEPVLAGPPVRASAAIAEERLLRLRQPFMQGADVREVQSALAAKGSEVEPDGVFGPQTAAAVIAFQRKEGLTADGIVGAATRARLGLG
jgi:chitosanase